MKNIRESTDIWFIGFLKIKGELINNYTVIGKNRIKCSFLITDEKWKEYKLEFDKSEYSKMKYAIESIKDLSF